MIELIQFPWSPYCIVQRRILEYAQVSFKIVNISPNDRSLVWRLSRQRYYQVPLLKDGKTVVFETDEDSQVIAKYLDNRLNLELFPRNWAGHQHILWRYVENEIEGLGFKLNDIYYEALLPKSQHLAYLRHKERKFGRGCVGQWRAQQAELLQQLARRLVPLEQMLQARPFLLEARPRFIDFDLYGMLGNFLYSGNYKIPAEHTGLKDWYQRMTQVTLKTA